MLVGIMVIASQQWMPSAMGCGSTNLEHQHSRVGDEMAT